VPYIVDFVSFEKRLVIEIDGGQHSQQVIYDNGRTEWLESQGFRVLRFWNNQVLQEIEAVKSIIWEALESRKSLDEKTPSPLMGEGWDGGERF
jgi:very-short-patch-repair endonuclease